MPPKSVRCVQLQYKKPSGLPDGGGEATLRGLELVTGGKARQLPMPTLEDEGGMVEAWGALKEALSSDQVVCARCDLGSPAASAAPASGIVPGRTYSVIVANDIAGNGEKLVRLRGFAGDPEWNGKWSDSSSEWNSRLRQLLAYLGQFVRATIHTHFQTSDGKAAEVPAEVSTAVLLVDALCKAAGVPRAAATRFIPAYIYDAINLPGAS